MEGRYTDAQLQELVDTSARLGWQLGLHAIGDAAIVQTDSGVLAQSRRGCRADKRTADGFCATSP